MEKITMPSLFTYWYLDGLMAIFLIGICLVYFYLTGFKIIRKSFYFFTGLGLILFSVASPLHFLGQNYLMSAHMLSHVIILLIAAPLLVLGIPAGIHHRLLIRFSEILSRMPWLPWITGLATMWFWHAPVIFNHLISSPPGNSISGGLGSWHVFENIHLMTLVLAGVIFSWPVIAPVLSARLAPLNAVLYLTAACIFCSILGLLITFAPAGIYTGYVHLEDQFGFLNQIRNGNGISVLVDQQIGGLIMWVPGCLIYLSASLFLLMKWFKSKNEMPVIETKHIGS